MRSREDLPGLMYASCYCEENIWHLCQRAELSILKPHVVLIFNSLGRVAMWQQRASEYPPIMWDYHVVLLCESTEGNWQLWDLDTRLNLPEPLEVYLNKSFPADLYELAPMFRVVPAAEYLKFFSSDRSHMKTPSGKWLAEPPPWEPIYNGTYSTLKTLLDLNVSSPGVIYSLEELRAAYCKAVVSERL